MRILLDTNILIRLMNANDGEHTLVSRAVEELSGAGHEMFMVPQGLYELWSVVTRPTATANGLSFDSGQAAQAVAELRALFRLLPDTPPIFERWLALVSQHQV